MTRAARRLVSVFALVVLVGASACGRSQDASTTRRAGVSAGGETDDPDGDGIVGAEDLCPLDAEDVDQYFDHDGCPDLDDDGDGIPDRCDACPLEAAETPNGCPATPRPDIPVAVIERVFAFDFRDDMLTPEVRRDVVELAARLREAFYYERIRIVGRVARTERTPDALGLRRAERVRALLVAHGVDPRRLDLLNAGTGTPFRDPALAQDEAAVRVVVERVDGRPRFVVRDSILVEHTSGTTRRNARRQRIRRGCSPR